MNTDIEGLEIYLLDSFDTMTTLLSNEATFVATKIPEFNKRKLKEQLKTVTSEEWWFADTFIPLVDAKHDMYNLQDFSNGLGVTIPVRNPKLHPTYEDIEVRRGDVKPVEIKAGSYVVICKYATGCSWELEWWFIQIVPKELPKINKDFYERTFLQPWDEIRRSLIVDPQHGGTVPRKTYENLIDYAYEMGYNKALGKDSK